MNIPEIMIPLMNVLLQIKRIKINNKIVRKVDTVTEISGIDSNNDIELTNIFKWDSQHDYYKISNLSSDGSIINKISDIKHILKDDLLNELENRKNILKWMLDKNISEYDDVIEVIHDYYTNPKFVLNNIKFGV
jgi:flagellar protein FlaI